MTNHNFLLNMVQQHDFFLVDTSSLMAVDWMRTFVEEAEPIFHDAGKTIIIPPAVRSELIRHYSSTDDEKRQKAQAAVNLLSRHRGLFQIPGGLLDDDEIARAFADAELLALLQSNRQRHRQLLITNDRALSSDAFNLNQQQSCAGSRISVCHVNRFGELQVCDCVQGKWKQPIAPSTNCTNLSADENKIEPLYEKDNSADTTLKGTAASNTEIVSNTPTVGKSSWWKWILTFLGGSACGFVAGKYNKEIQLIIGTALSVV